MIHATIDGIKAIISEEDTKLFKKLKVSDVNMFNDEKLTSVEINDIKLIISKSNISKAIQKLEKAFKKK